MKWLTQAMRSQLESLCAAFLVPLGVPVAWIEMESGGNISSTTSLNERGYFQLMPEESERLQLNHDRLSYDSAYSLNAGFKLINYYRMQVQSLCSSLGGANIWPGTEYAWCTIKLAHSMGMGSVRAILSDAVDAKQTLSWEQLELFAVGRDDHYLKQLHHSTKKWFGFIDKWADIGRPYSLSQLVCTNSGGPLTNA